MAKKKLTKKIVQAMRARRKAGATYEDLGRAFDVSAGSVANALKRAPSRSSRSRTSSPAKGQSPPAMTSVVALTLDDLRGFLAQQARALRNEVAQSKEPSARLALNRSLLAVQQLLARITPEDDRPDPRDNPDWAALAASARAKLHRYVDEAASGSPNLRSHARDLISSVGFEQAARLLSDTRDDVAILVASIRDREARRRLLEDVDGRAQQAQAGTETSGP